MTTVPLAGPHEQTFAPETTSPEQARDFVARYLDERGMPSLVDACCLVVSELVTNAVVHARTVVRVSVEELASCVEVRVYDGSAEPPVPASAGRVSTLDESGRGLSIVDVVCDDWGIDVSDEGKCIWAVLGVPIPRSEDPTAAGDAGAPGAHA